ncbi:MAG: DUF4173 domain-containing protein [Armatimonadetes bacterium]|nr:DUF4173 domain-containing protein [Armatimonadota bacterium]
MKVALSVVLSVFAAATLFGLVCQQLLVTGDIGFNMSLIALTFFLAIVILKWRNKIVPDFKMWVLAVPFCAGIYGYAVPDSRGLDSLNTWMVLLTVSYCALRAAASRPLSLVESIGKAPLVLFVLPWCAFPLLGVIDWKQSPKNRNIHISRGALIGCLTAVPFLAVFGSLLGQADPMFANMFSFNLQIDPDQFVVRSVIFAMTACFMAGVLSYFSKPIFNAINVMLSPNPTPPPYPMMTAPNAPTPADPKEPAGQATEHATIFITFFGLISAMFLLFALVQVRYLFGGNSVVQLTQGLTYADYARRGFLEIVTVAGICLPLVVFGQYALRNLSTTIRKGVNIVIWIVVALLMLLLASAAFRLKLYIGAYGLSPLRVYVGAGMLWLLVLFVTYLIYGTKWQLDKIGKVVYGAMVFITLGLNIARPDYWIARVNLTRSHAVSIDPTMITDAGADARPAIVQFGKKELLDKFDEMQSKRSRDWRDLTLSQMALPAPKNSATAPDQSAAPRPETARSSAQNDAVEHPVHSASLPPHEG